MQGTSIETAEHPAFEAERARLASLARCRIAGTPPEAAFDRLADLAADLFGTPLCAISFLDAEHQWVKAGIGFGGLADFPRADGLCATALAGEGVLVVPDAAADPRFRDLPAVRGPLGIRFYAGVPLVTRRGHRLGVLCVADRVPRRAPSAKARARLARIGSLVMEAVAQRGRTMARRDANGFVAATAWALITTDGAGTITFANAACERLLGYGPGELLGRDVGIIVPVRLRGHHAAGLKGVASGRAPRLDGKTVEVTALCRDGSEIPVELSLTLWGSGETLGVGAVLRDISERRRRDARLLRLAHQDPRTGLPNRARLTDDLAAHLAEGRPATLLAIAVEGLRGIGDGFGQAVGDALVEALVVRLTGRLPAEALLARTGEDELAVLLPGQDDAAAARALAEGLIPAVTDPLSLGEHVLHVGARVALAHAPAHGTDAEELMASLDLALDGARREPAGRVRAYEPAMRERAAERRALQDALRGALLAGEIVLAYQPQIDLATGAIRGVEALIRWQHPERGLLPPADFLPAIESSALALRFGWWTIDEACRQAAAWRAAGLPDVTVAVNLFSEQVRAGTLADVVLEALARHGLPPAALEIELTEVIALLDDAGTRAALSRLHAHGVGIALDDFGTGYASLSTLKLFPLTKLKIDRGFVRDILADPHDAAIVRAVLEIGRGLDLAVVAEGIETPEQEAALVGMGCTCGQGYLYGRAVGAEEIARRLARPGALRPQTRVA
ncbi:PAS domain S-box-containing protein/diguanylate cyclase (GGDEF)-like protein [Methylobacterium sp. BE186]|uniref:putative bifunctional diguanylate cyclase/phosphodiesterase n=1 Tax=Methylobacterium sp. BE186 TaxID=2817715 RepID=UPI00285E25D9|nr:EAL domain-containing protein [Methylobacterium sp. BE186]MDR7035874.1 PAS domain S-box-containing protein/diguanylate cyclase (GGDEF)-like protein [Methylobacterium sp. BE186]